MRSTPFKSSTFALFALLILLVSSCDSNDPEAPGITSADLLLEAARGTSVDAVFTLRAEEGIKSLSLSIDGGEAQVLQVTSGASEQEFTYTFTVPASATLGTQFMLMFTLTDQEDATSEVSVLVTTTRLIETPDTYEFFRNGESSVFFGGQTDRLDQVEEIKAYVKLADAGGVITEQVLLDMFQNTGGNGAGNFTFTSSRQLKNKTFAPDVDVRLFEDLFENAAAASIAGNAGTVAANGTAGLITRENSGNTVLVDGNGREFTQFIEKGLMGAVFYHQMYNVYLSDARTGDDVENVELDGDNNYTRKEHGMDEAFGYWDPPLDFTSPWPAERGNEDRFWSHYSSVVDGQLGTNDIIMTAFREGRAAIVNNDPAGTNAERDVLYENLELVAAATTVHYINDTIEFLSEGKIGEAFHVLSEAWAFTNALRYSPRRSITPEQITEILDTDFGAGGNFWNVTPAGLNKAKATLVGLYPRLAPVQDDL